MLGRDEERISKFENELMKPMPGQNNGRNVSQAVVDDEMALFRSSTGAG